MRLSLGDYLRLARGVPARELLPRAWGVLRRGIRDEWTRWKDYAVCTHPSDSELPAGELPCWLPELEPQAIERCRLGIDEAARRICEHCFDLLGSGPVVVKFGLEAAGVEGHRYRAGGTSGQVNRANRGISRRLTSRCSSDYEPIDWHIDFKSGYRWSEATWFKRIDYCMLPGADVKVPWELARGQHLPQLALAALLAHGERRASCLREFRDQIFDFMAHNPPRFGVNWCCTMDVAIRAANWVLAYQLFRSACGSLDDVFEREFRRALVAHGRHIVDNLEWFPTLRSNHYLANLCGLLFIAAQLPPGPEADAWLAVSVPELISEFFQQFQPDGSNFEASTSYHRLSGEMAVYALALLRAIPAGRLERALQNGTSGLRFRGPGPRPDDFVVPLEGTAAIPWGAIAERLSRVRDFTSAVTRPDGKVVQVGDNDSGRFFQLEPTNAEAAVGAGAEIPGEHGHLVGALGALLGDARPEGQLDGEVVAALIGNRTLGAVAVAGAALQPRVFSDFGLSVYSSERLWCALRCGSVGQRGNGGHAHNDQLSIELCADGVAFLIDPGTYLYTPVPDLRNRMRSTGVHNTIVTGEEQYRWTPGRLGLFSITASGRPEILASAPQEWWGRYHAVDGCCCARRLGWLSDRLEVIDTFDGAFVLNFQLACNCRVVRESARTLRLERGGKALRLSFADGEVEVGEGVFSAAYGIAEAAPRVRVSGLERETRWTAEACSEDRER